MSEIALVAEGAMTSQGEAAELGLVKRAGVAELIASMRKGARSVVADTVSKQFLAELGASQIWQRSQLFLAVCERTIRTLGARVEDRKLAHPCLGEVSGLGLGLARLHRSSSLAG